ncbi:enoyl-CoA hydratase-related protein [Nocardia sp. NBC_01377]|uniref:enoyl-CoA hydratase-related protein n=1 Tax=Nocardia sp. NBC_01377 TaxID=2903595 RepID=UPI0032565955
MGLVNSVVPADELLHAAQDLDGRIIRHAPTAVAACLRAVTRGIDLPIHEGLAVEAACFAATVHTEGVRTVLRRFLARETIPALSDEYRADASRCSKGHNRRDAAISRSRCRHSGSASCGSWVRRRNSTRTHVRMLESGFLGPTSSSSAIMSPA